LSADLPPEGLSRLIGHHPAAVRSVSFGPSAEDDGLCHLELETKHGQVSLIHHSTGQVFQSPPRPPDAAGPRRERDLTAAVPCAFDGRPRFTGVEVLIDKGALAGYRFTLSTGATLSFVLDEHSPSLTSSVGG
jgi:hypothetical protein